MSGFEKLVVAAERLIEEADNLCACEDPGGKVRVCGFHSMISDAGLLPALRAAKQEVAS